MMRNAWNMEGGTTYNNKKRGWANTGEKKNAPKLSEEYNKRFPGKAEELRGAKGRSPYGGDEERALYGKSPLKGRQSNEEPGKGKEKPIVKVRNALKKRGGTGIIGLARQFKIFDDNNSKTLDRAEFIKAVGDFNIGLTENEINQVFDQMDIDGSGEIDYEEFLRKIRGKMNERRQQIVLQAFDKLDVDGSGVS